VLRRHRNDGGKARITLADDDRNARVNRPDPFGRLATDEPIAAIICCACTMDLLSFGPGGEPRGYAVADAFDRWRALWDS